MAFRSPNRILLVKMTFPPRKSTSGVSTGLSIHSGFKNPNVTTQSNFSQANLRQSSLNLSLPTIILLFFVSPSLFAEGIPPEANQFLRTHCFDCHEGVESSGGLDLSELSGDLSEAGVMKKWVRIHDRVRDGEMPPPDDYGQLKPDENNPFLSKASRWLSDHQRKLNQKLGRSRGRRLTNLQLQRTLNDLLAIQVPLAKLMPDEPRVDGFTNIADSQTMSHFHLDTHLQVVDAALDRAFRRLAHSRSPRKLEFDARGVARQNPRQRCRDPEMLDGAAVVWSSSLVFYGRISSTQVPRDGWYRVTFRASAKNLPENDRKNGQGVWCTIRSGVCKSTAPLMYWIGAFETHDEIKEWTFDAWIQEDHVIEIRPADATIRKAKFRGGQVGAGEGTPQNVPGIAIHSLEVEEIFPGGDRDKVRRRLIGAHDVEFDRKTRSLRFINEPKMDELESQVTRFMRRAFRRPVGTEDANQYLSILRNSIEDGQSKIEALRNTYRAILCSPRFLYHYETAGKLDDYAIASRLSYMITGSMPDDELDAAAGDGQLSDPAQLHRQVERLLASPHCETFVKEFAAQWLDLVDIEFTDPDRRLYPEFDIVVLHSMLDETHAFLQTLIRNDSPAVRLVRAPFTFLNSRLARYYDIDDVTGDELRRVSLTRDSHRGGLLTHGSILKVTANGTNTSPVLRGVWLCNRLLGQPIPPPPENVPAIEPDIRGAKTVREMLEQHRSNADCASCHSKIDPPGFALENFDPAGKWRDRYVRRDGKKMKRGAVIDVSYELADGRAFDSFNDFRRMISDDPEPIARNFAEKLVVYATGAPIAFSDRKAIEQIVKKTKNNDYGLRSIIAEVVASPLFLNK